MLRSRLIPLGLAFGLLCAAHVQVAAQSLPELYEAARGFDSAFQSAKAQLDANQYRVDQARAAFLPKLGLVAGVTSTYASVAPDQGPKSDRGFGAANAAVRSPP